MTGIPPIHRRAGSCTGCSDETTHTFTNCRGGFQTRPGTRDTNLMVDGNPNWPQRRALRLRHHDYRDPGAYFVTICTHQRKCIFGSIPDTIFEPSSLGTIVANCWARLPDHYPNLSLDSFVIMPNHVHGLIFLTETPPRHPLSEIIRGFKTFSAKRINQKRHASGIPVWQRGFHEHVVRKDKTLDRIREYIQTNPARWAIDQENPSVTRAGHRPAPTSDSGSVGAGFKPARKTGP